MGWLTGFEPATPDTTNRCSNQLSYSHHPGKRRLLNSTGGAPCQCFLKHSCVNAAGDPKHFEISDWISFVFPVRPLFEAIFLTFVRVSLGHGAMNRIENAFAKAKSEGRSAFVSYVCAGDPDRETSLDVCRTLIASGVDVLELGVPFSDPLADGLTNQLAAQRALESGTTREDVFDLVRAIRNENDTVPVVLYTYYNLMFSGGLDAYIAEAKEAGVDGLLFLDLPPEEAEDYMMACEKVGMKTVFLLAPTTPVERVAYIAGFTTGFIYYVSRTGVTGVRDDLADDLKEMVDMIKSNSDKPLVVGFGIHSREQVKAVSDLADGVVVGSAIVNTIKDNLGNRDAILERMGVLVRDLVEGTKTG